MSKDTSESAFPAPFLDGMGQYGMTLRDYFAAKAMQGFVAHPESDYAPLIDDKVPMLAREAYRLADAMLAERAK